MIVAAIVIIWTIPLVSCVATLLRRRHGESLRLDAATTVILTGIALVAATLATSGTAHGVAVVGATVGTWLAAVAGGGPVVRVVLRAGGVTSGDEDNRGHTDSPAGADEKTTTSAPLHGGRLIGFLERGAVAGTLLLGWPEGLAIILAVKSLARYPELRAPHASEQFIIGTFTSVLWASGISGIGYLILH